MRLVDVDWELNSCFSSFSGRWIHHDWIRSRMQPLCHTFQWGLLYHFVENHYCNDFNHISVMQSKENGIKSCMMFRLWAVLRLLNTWRHMKCKKHMHCFVHRPGKCHAGEPRDAQIPQKMIIPNQQEHSESLVKTSLVVAVFRWGLFPSNGTLIPKQVHKILTKISRIVRIFLCSMTSYVIFFAEVLCWMPNVFVVT